MKVFFHEAQRSHDPKQFLSSGASQPNPEKPARIDALLSGVQSSGLEIAPPSDNGLAAISAVHTTQYLTFLKNVYPRWQRIEGSSKEVIPNIHPDRRNTGYPKSVVGQAGYHMADTACPISRETWQSAYWSAQSAITAAERILKGDPVSYALCRPPGHHAFGDRAGGFCFLNNSAIAAERCTNAGQRVAILDIDVHHGNGTQGIFYHRADVLTISIHAHPERFYPFFWGYDHEHGEGAGLGANLNLPMPRGTDDDAWLETMAVAVERIKNFSADVLVIALGLDAYIGDPFKGFAITTHGFSRMGEACAALFLPTVMVQEGGYLCPELGENLAGFLGGFMNRHKI